MESLLATVSETRLGAFGTGQLGFDNFPYSMATKELTSVLLFLSSHVGVDSFISNISLGSSFGWYFKVTQFELIFLGLIMLQICILRYIEVLPINMNNLFLGDPSGRRKRRGLDVCQRDALAESILKVLKKLDDGECLPFVLCELQALSMSHIPNTMDFELPKETKQLLLALRMSKKNREKSEDCEMSENMIYFEEAVNFGYNSDNRYLNSTACQNRYHSCPMTSEDLIQYVGTIVKADML